MTPSSPRGPVLSRLRSAHLDARCPSLLRGSFRGSFRGSSSSSRKHPDTRAVPHPCRARPLPCETIQRKPPARFRRKDIAGLLRFRLENSRNGGRLPRPFARLALELFASKRRQDVILDRKSTRLNSSHTV